MTLRPVLAFILLALGRHVPAFMARVCGIAASDDLKFVGAGQAYARVDGVDFVGAGQAYVHGRGIAASDDIFLRWHAFMILRLVTTSILLLARVYGISASDDLYFVSAGQAYARVDGIAAASDDLCLH